ncbi:MAG: hypothetical protein QOG74_1680, partial [Alphaproteobacteria bacterium]|nr:hypothetical protein [Alphaproteobacteria bacterium]
MFEVGGAAEVSVTELPRDALDQRVHSRKEQLQNRR